MNSASLVAMEAAGRRRTSEEVIDEGRAVTGSTFGREWVGECEGVTVGFEKISAFNVRLQTKCGYPSCCPG